MEAGLSLLSVVAQGAKSNLWGLACPFYCGSFPASSFICCVLVGWILGLGTAFLAWTYLCYLPQPSEPPSQEILRPAADPRIISYLHERGLLQRRRR